MFSLLSIIMTGKNVFGELVVSVLELEETMKVYALSKAASYKAPSFEALLMGFHKSELAFDKMWNKWDLTEEMLESKFPLMTVEQVVKFERGNQKMCKWLLRSKNLFTSLKERVVSFNNPTLHEFHGLVMECQVREDEAASTFSEVVQALKELQFHIADTIVH